MEHSQIYSKKSFFIIILLHVFIGVILGFGLHYGIGWLTGQVAQEPSMGNSAGTGVTLVQAIEWAGQNYLTRILPVMAAVLFLWSLCLWAVLKIPAREMVKTVDAMVSDMDVPGPGKKDSADQRIEQEKKRRIYLHTLAVLQREGRLLDFFDEDLSLYEDEQIGAAVRSIQEDCKKAVKKYIDPKPVFDVREGDTVTIEPGFDMDQVKLVGNVAGEPPFQGVLRHRGWRAGKREVPRLLDVSDSSIISPAEVEVE